VDILLLTKLVLIADLACLAVFWDCPGLVDTDDAFA
jgi:hypothetical protein